ncbi:hypothetical protein ACWKSP_15880 [Micromonosporaceae bacterium Da 78-11]
MTSEDTTYPPIPAPDGPSGELAAQDGVADRAVFGHSNGVTRNPGGRISSTTRYLSGAAYVDEKYAEVVVDELVGESHRAVAPSLGYDVTTVVRHCFRAQRLWLVQNALITAILLVGLRFLTGPTVLLFLLCLAGWYVRPEPGRPRKRSWKSIAVAVVVVVVLGCLAGPLVALTEALRSGSFDSGTLGNDLDPSAPDSPSGGWTSWLIKSVVAFLLVGGAILAVLVWSRTRMIATITAELGRGRPPGPPQPESSEVEQRLRVIDEAQHGNILMHAGYEPFVGAGFRANAWSVATELRPEEEPGTGRSADPARRVEIDPVELVAHLRQRLAALRSRELPSTQRITGLQLRDQVISSGTWWTDFPLIDDRSRLPFSFAGPEAIEAIIRAPQTGARHFLRATSGAPEQAALGADGRTIMPAEHQSVVTSTYLHVAVEGGLLYMEVVTAVLGPIRQQYLNIDRYEGGTDRLSLAFGESVRRFAAHTAVAPVRLVRSLLRLRTLPGAIHRADREAATAPVYDFGARLDVRQLASRGDYANYLQRLDAAKYTRLIDRRATAAIHEFLTAKGVDTADFAAKVNFHQYNSTTIGGSAYGPVATGTGASATMTTTAAAATSKGGTA